MRILKTGEVWKIESSFEERDRVKAVRVNGAGAWWHGLPCSRPRCGACAAHLGKTWWTADPNVAAAFGFAAEDDATRRGLEAIVATRRDAIDASRATEADLEIPCPPGLAYMPFQKAGIAYALGRANVLIGDEMGTGKSIQTCGILNMLPYPERRRVLVVCPASLRINWKRELEKWLVETTSIGVVEGSKWPEGSPDIVIINYDVLVRHLDTLTARRWDVMVMDECFPAGTMVQTPTGHRRIEDMRPGDRVVSAVGEDRVVAVSTRDARRLLRVGFSDGTNVVCTQNHPFFTASGWVRAMDLSRKHCMITGHEAMRILRQPVRRQWRKKKEPFLRDILLSEVADATAGNTGEDLHACIQRGANKATQGRSRKAPRVGNGIKHSDERAQSNGGPRYARSQPGDITSDRTQAADPGWERAWPNGSGVENHGCYPGPSLESCSEDRRAKGDGLSNVLQSGFGDPGPEVSYRSGRVQPRGTSQAGGGQEEGCAPLRPRVVSIEVLEQDDPGEASRSGGGYQVFNLQVERHPSYVVNGLLVHNCHAVKNPKAQRTKAVLLIQAKRRVALTGTPILNRPIEFWTLAHMLAPAEFPSWKRYVDRYCAPEVVYTPRGPVTTYTGASNLEELQARARGSCITGDTWIDSEDGRIQIRDLVAKPIPPRVWAFDPVDGLSLRSVVGTSRRAYRDRLLLVVTDGGERLVCTPEHLIQTEQGYVRADCLAGGDVVFALRKEHESGLRWPDGLQLLFENVLREGSGGESCGTRANVCDETSEARNPRPGVQLREGVHSEGHRLGADKNPLLQNVLVRAEVHPPWSGPSAPETVHDREGSGYEARCSPSGYFCSAEGEKAPACNSRENEAVPTDEMGVAAWDHRNECSPVLGSKPSERAARGYEARAIDAIDDPWVPARVGGVSGAGRSGRVLRGHSSRSNEDGYRGGRTHPRAEDTADSRQGTDETVGVSRVCRIEVLELGDRRRPSFGSSEDHIVYDIEVDRAHNFFANGILVHNCMIRRLRSEVLRELPGKRRQIIPLPWNGAAPVVRHMNEEWEAREERLASLKVAALGAPNEEEYKAAVKALADAEKIAFEEISAARKALALAKVPKVIEHATELLEDGVQKLVVFGHHKEVISRIVEGLKAYNPVVLVGDTSMNDRQAAVDSFQTDPNVRVFVGSIRAAGVGLTLTAASTMVYAELDWTPGIVSQSEDRCVRIGQKNMVLIQHLVFDDSLDSHLAKVLVEKQEIIDRALDVPVDLPELAPLAADPLPAKVSVPRAFPTVSPDLRAAVHEALAYLAACCDGARSKDGMGFNRHDAAFGRQLALLSTLTDRQALAGQKLIRKYRGQLGESLAHRAGIAGKEES